MPVNSKVQTNCAARNYTIVPDPIIQSPDFTQSYNSYSYCWNNPLKFSDPSGYYPIPAAEEGESYQSSSPDDPWLNPGKFTFKDYLESMWNGNLGLNLSLKKKPSGIPYANNEKEEPYFTVLDKSGKPVKIPVSLVAKYNPSALLGFAQGGGDGQIKSVGDVISFSFDFAFAGGFGFEIGRVRDNFGNKKLFISGNANTGYGLSAGFNYKEILNVNGHTFNVTNYQGNTAGFSWGALIVGYEKTGDKPTFGFTGFKDWGYTYIQEGGNISILSAPKLGAWWTISSTKFIFP